jgi:hypothetical protein
LNDDWKENSSRHSIEKWENLLEELESSAKMAKVSYLMTVIKTFAKIRLTFVESKES